MRRDGGVGRRDTMTTRQAAIILMISYGEDWPWPIKGTSPGKKKRILTAMKSVRVFWGGG